MTDGADTRTCQLYVNDTVAIFTTPNITAYRVSLCQTVRLHTIDRANPAIKWRHLAIRIEPESAV